MGILKNIFERAGHAGSRYFPLSLPSRKKMPLTANHGMDKNKMLKRQRAKIGRVGVINVNPLSTF